VAAYNCAVAIEGTQIVDSTTAVGHTVAVNQENHDPYFGAGSEGGVLYECSPDLSSCNKVSNLGEIDDLFYAAYDKSVWAVSSPDDSLTPISAENVVGISVGPPFENYQINNGCAQANGPEVTAVVYYIGQSNFIYNINTGKSTTFPMPDAHIWSCAYSSFDNGIVTPQFPFGSVLAVLVPFTALGLYVRKSALRKE
jgi:hypothetical protein